MAPLEDLRETYTHADFTLYADCPELVPTEGLPGNHRYIGPVIWSPEIPLPAWWESLPKERPCVYVTMGSSGQVRTLPAILEALSALDVNVLLATAGRMGEIDLPKNCYSATYLPGSAAARRSRLVICNGGSATVYQALAEGTPVLGVASNMDQMLTMEAVEAAGAGRLVRPERLTSRRMGPTITTLAEQDGPATRAARTVGAWFATWRAYDRFPVAVSDTVGARNEKGGISAPFSAIPPYRA
jgi:UDP:flavonoid glycosyltransferase YjiC (YdhE family)